MGSKWAKTMIFSKKVVKKQLFWVSRLWIIQLRTGLWPIFLKISLTSTGVLKNLEHKLQNELWARRQTSILAESKFFEIFLRSITKKCQKRFFLLFGKLLEILILKHISRVPPWESSRPDVSENVVVFGPRSSGMGVIAARSWRTAKFLGPLQKIRGVTKKRHGHNNEFWALPSNQRGTNHVGPTLIPYQSPKLNIVAVSY